MALYIHRNFVSEKFSINFKNVLTNSPDCDIIVKNERMKNMEKPNFEEFKKAIENEKLVNSDNETIVNMSESIKELTLKILQKYHEWLCRQLDE